MVKKQNNTKYSHRWNLLTEKWERKPVGKKVKWEAYERSTVKKPEWDYNKDQDFVRVWAQAVLENGSQADVARTFDKSSRQVYARRRAINEKYAKKNGLDDKHELLPSLPNLTAKQKQRIQTHFTPKPKPPTLKERLLNLPPELRSVLDF